MRHPYLDHDTCVARLLDWHARFGRIIVAYDFDNTVYDYHGRGHDYGEVIELIRRAKREAGVYLIVFTGNENTRFVRTFLAEHDIPYDAINEQAPFAAPARKIYYNLLLDDAAGLASACGYLESYLEALSNQAQKDT